MGFQPARHRTRWRGVSTTASPADGHTRAHGRATMRDRFQPLTQAHRACNLTTVRAYVHRGLSLCTGTPCPKLDGVLSLREPLPMHGHAEITNLHNTEVWGASPYVRARHTPHAPRSLSIRGRFDLRRSPTGPLSAWPPVPSPRAPGTPSRARIATTFPQQATRLQVNTRTGKTTPTTKKEGVHVIFVTSLEHMRFLPYKHPRAEKRAHARMYVRACYPAVARRGVWSASPPPAPSLATCAHWGTRYAHELEIVARHVVRSLACRSAWRWREP